MPPVGEGGGRNQQARQSAPAVTRVVSSHGDSASGTFSIAALASVMPAATVMLASSHCVRRLDRIRVRLPLFDFVVIGKSVRVSSGGDAMGLVRLSWRLLLQGEEAGREGPAARRNWRQDRARIRSRSTFRTKY